MNREIKLNFLISIGPFKIFWIRINAKNAENCETKSDVGF